MPEYSVPSIEKLKQMSLSELTETSNRIRSFLIDSVSRTGGHIGANLSVVELTVALHYVFESPERDRIIFDTGHQGYTQKLLTGRQSLFHTLNRWQGLSRFLSRRENPTDLIEATHGGTAPSLATGMAFAHLRMGHRGHVVAVIGDGSLVEGMAFEGLNYASEVQDLGLIVVINDNAMAIAPNVGGIKNLTQAQDWEQRSRAYFEGLGFEYIAVPDGHDLKPLIQALRRSRALAGPVVVHVKTEKGRGLDCARTHPYRMHFSMPFDPATGKGASPTVAGKTYAVVAARALIEALREDEKVIVITPATPYASALEECQQEFPERVIDVGMAEQHAAGMACGLALEGMKPVVCFQTTFMQRAFDQLLHDICFMELPVTILGVRSGFAGYDGPTHHGLYDIPYLRSLPRMQVQYPVDSKDLHQLLRERLRDPQGPMVILHPYPEIPEPEPDSGQLEPSGLSLVAEGGDGLLLCIGNRLEAAHEIRKLLGGSRGYDFGLACIRSLKPFPAERVFELCNGVSRVVTLEESTLPGGFGSLVGESLLDRSSRTQLLRSGVPDRFVPGGSQEECSRECGMAPFQVLERILARWPELARERPQSF